MTLSTLAVILGLGFALPQLFGIFKPAQFRDAVRRFPRSNAAGYALMALGTAWFFHYFGQESVSDFVTFKPYMYAAFTLIAVGTCVFVSDFLAARGLAVVLLLLAKLMVDTARWAESDWRLVIVTWAYVLAVAGMWFTIAPWRLRDLLHWGTANDHRVRVGSGVRMAFGLFVALLGVTVF
jgi:hypothetical protein